MAALRGVATHSTPTVAMLFTIVGSACCGWTGFALINSVTITWMSVLAIATAWLIGTDSPVESLQVRLEGAEKLVGELEAARHGALMDRARMVARHTFRFSALGSDCSPPPSPPPGPPSPPPGPPSRPPSSFAPSEPETTPSEPETTSSRPHNVSDTHGMVPSGHFFAGQTAAGKVLLCEMAVVDGGKRCTWVDLGSEERITLMEELHASRCDHYFHLNASLAQPRVVGRYGMPVILKANLLVAENREGVELIAQIEGSEQRLMGLVAESKEVAVQALAAWIRCSDEEAAVPLPSHIIRFLANPGVSAEPSEEVLHAAGRSLQSEETLHAALLESETPR